MRKIVIMIIDSQPFFRAGVRQALSQQNTIDILDILECEPGDDGREAVTQITASSPDVVLLDIGYPSLRGLDLGKKIVRFFPATKVVMLSSNPDENDEELFEVIKTGAVAYLRSEGAAAEKDDREANEQVTGGGRSSPAGVDVRHPAERRCVSGRSTSERYGGLERERAGSKLRAIGCQDETRAKAEVAFAH